MEATIYEIFEAVLAFLLFAVILGTIISISSSNNLEMELLKTEIDVLLEISKNKNIEIDLEINEEIKVEQQGNYIVYSVGDEFFDKKTKYLGDLKINQEDNMLKITS